MMLEHLLDHRISLIQMTRLHRLVDLARRGIRLRQHRTRASERENQNQ